MNRRIVGKYLGLLTLFLAVNLLAPLVCSMFYREREAAANLIGAMIVALLIGGVLFLYNYNTKEELYRKEALAIVGLGWLLTAFIGAVPYIFYGLGSSGRQFGSLWDCYFESMSGFTTTGATILTNIEALPRGLLFWRSYTHWLGGMGIIVLFVAVLPYLGAGGKQLFKTEVPGPIKEGLRPKIRESAMILWMIYLGFTAVETVMLMLCGLSLFDALCHTFGTLATGGFSTYNDSIAHFSSMPDVSGAMMEAVIIVFMYAAGINFTLHFSLLKNRDWRGMLKDPEWQWYTGIILCSGILITMLIYGQEDRGMHIAHGVQQEALSSANAQAIDDGSIDRPLLMGGALRQAMFQTVSIQTTTGYTTSDFNQWPDLARFMLVLMMFVGGMAGSTGGGMKVMRVVLVFKIGIHHLERVFSPRVVRQLRFGRGVVDPEIQIGILSFFVLCLMLFIGSSMILALFGYNLVTSLTAVAACLFNIGPGLGPVGAIENYAFFDPVTKIWLSILMALGRLELYSILVLIVPSFWRSH